MVVPRSFGTHDGTFHADEVTACALLLAVGKIDFNLITRTRNLSILKTCEYVCDVGGVYNPEKKRFDHHQLEYKGSLSSAGMVLEYLKTVSYLTPKEHEFLNNTLVKGVDAHDNGKDPQLPGFCSFSHIISNFGPITHEANHSEQTQNFFKAVLFAQEHIQRSISRFQYNQSSRDDVKKAMDVGKQFLLFERSIPWMDLFFELGGIDHPASFVIMPSGQQWKLRGIPPSLDEKMRVRIDLPDDWAGLLDSELKKVSGIDGAVFCHKGKFISVWESQEDALKALETILKKISR
ncbi:MAG: MYG1 family protein [Chlamydia sp.]